MVSACPAGRLPPSLSGQAGLFVPDFGAFSLTPRHLSTERLRRGASAGGAPAEALPLFCFHRSTAAALSGALTPLYVKTAAQEASLSCWRVRKSLMTR